MLNYLSNALKDNDYYLVMYGNKLYIYKYEEILHFSEDLILVKLNNKKIKIKGSKMLIKKMENNELLIEGLISGVTYE